MPQKKKYLMSSFPIGPAVGAGVMGGDDDVGAVVVGCKDIVGAGVGISFMSQPCKKLKHSNPFGQSILRPDWLRKES